LENAARCYIENNENVFERIVDSKKNAQCFKSEC